MPRPRRARLLPLLLLLLGTATADNAPPPAAAGVKKADGGGGGVVTATATATPSLPPFGSEPDPAAPKRGWTADAFPNPSTDPVACGRPAGRPHGSMVCDPDGVLSTAGADAVEGVLRDIASARPPYTPATCGGATRPSPGFQVAVALVDKLRVDSGSDAAAAAPAAAAAAAFARGVMDAWGVGAAGCNDGALLVLSRSDKQVYILAGAGATGTLPPASSAAIIAAMGPRLRAGDWDGAVRQGVADVGLTLGGADPPAADAGGGGGFDWGLVLFGAIFAGIAGSGLRQAAGRRREVRAVRGLLDKLRREQEGAAAAAAYPAESCPVCLEDFDHHPPAAVGGGGGGGAGAGAASPAPGVVAAVATAPLLSSGRGHCCDADAAAPPSAPLLGGGGGVGGVGGGTGAASLALAPPHPPRRPLALPCGHTFCEPCLTRWLDGGGHTTCPICRAAVTTAGAGSGPATTTTQAQPTPLTATALGGGRRPWDPDLYAPELLFRLGSVRRLYPALVGVEVLDSWARAVRRGERPSAAWADEARDFALHDGATARRQQREGGAWGASAGFGGGTSAGGGGAGGTW